MGSLSARANDLLCFIRAHVKAEGISPSFEQMAVRLGLSPRSKASVQRVVDQLVWGGYLARTHGRARSLKPVQTLDYHVADCDCAGCARSRYLADLQIVNALQVGPPAHLITKFKGLRPLSRARRIEWLGDQRKSSVRQSAPKLPPAVSR